MSTIAFSEYLDYVESPNLKMTFPDVMEQYMQGENNKALFLQAYNTLPEVERKRLHAAFKILNTNTTDEVRRQCIDEMMNKYTWSAPENTLQNVVEYVSKKFRTVLKYPHPTNYYDVHVYFDKEERAVAQKITNELTRMGIRCYGLHSGPVGPHPKCMFEAHLVNPEQYYVITNYLSTCKLVALVHPNDPFTFEQQHFELARWINGKLNLRLDW